MHDKISNLTMLLEAVSRGRLYQVKFLLESFTEDVNKVDENRQTALMKAIFLPDTMHRTSYKIVKILLDHKAHVNVADREGRTALMWACIRGQENVVRKILDASILDLDLNGGDKYGNTALFYAAASGEVNTVKRLVTAIKRFGLDIDKKNAQGMTPILEATKRGHDECAQVLVTEGKASLTIRDPETFLNTKEWAEKRSLTNLSELIARRSPSPQMAVQNVENDLELHEVISSASDLENENNQRNLANESGNGNEQAARSPQQRRGSLLDHEKIKGPIDTLPSSRQGRNTPLITENKKEGSVSSRSSTPTVSLTRRKSELFDKTKIGKAAITAKSEMCRLLSLYGIQHSESYRQSFDPILLPPSGYWPDPLAHLRDNTSFVGDDYLESSFLDLLRPRGSGRRRSSAFPGAPDMGRRGSSVAGRKGSIMPNGSCAGMGKRGSIAPSLMSMGVSKNFLETPGLLTSRRTTLSANSARGTTSLSPFDRRGSLMPRGSQQTRPTLPRRTTTHITVGLRQIQESQN